MRSLIAAIFYCVSSFAVAPAMAETGRASYYCKGFSGNKTASGDRYDCSAMTCAHRSAPFGTKLRVTNTNNGLSVICTVNDRGPFVRGRIVDGSLAVARKLRMLGPGHVPVKVERIGK